MAGGRHLSRLRVFLTARFRAAWRGEMNLLVILLVVVIVLLTYMNRHGGSP